MTYNRTIKVYQLRYNNRNSFRVVEEIYNNFHFTFFIEQTMFIPAGNESDLNFLMY